MEEVVSERFAAVTEARSVRKHCCGRVCVM
jgi:hypothetical protein